MAKEVQPRAFELDLTEEAKGRIQTFVGEDLPVLLKLEKELEAKKKELEDKRKQLLEDKKKKLAAASRKVEVQAYSATPWTLKRTDTNAIHTFNYNPLVLPSVTYEQAMTEHRLLSKAIKYDKSSVKIKVLHVVWGEQNPMFRTEREVLETWLDLNCKMVLKWYDHDGHEHNDKGYFIADASRPVYQVGYTFGFSLKLTEEA